MNGPFARAEELWIACASKVFPVPVSPRRTSGTSVFAASAASCKQRAMASLLVVRSSILNLESGSCIVVRELLPHALAQLSNWFECIFDHRPSTDDDVCVSSHPHPERQNLPWTGGNHRTIQGAQRDEMRAITGSDGGRADPVELAGYSAITLVRECLEKVPYAQDDGEPWKAGFV